MFITYYTHAHEVTKKNLHCLRASVECTGGHFRLGGRTKITAFERASPRYRRRGQQPFNLLITFLVGASELRGGLLFDLHGIIRANA